MHRQFLIEQVKVICNENSVFLDSYRTHIFTTLTVIVDLAIYFLPLQQAPELSQVYIHNESIGFPELRLQICTRDELLELSILPKVLLLVLGLKLDVGFRI